MELGHNGKSRKIVNPDLQIEIGWNSMYSRIHIRTPWKLTWPPKTSKNNKKYSIYGQWTSFQRDHAHVVKSIKVFQYSASQYRIQGSAICFPPNIHLNHHLISCRWCWKPPKNMANSDNDILFNKKVHVLVNFPHQSVEPRYVEESQTSLPLLALKSFEKDQRWIFRAIFFLGGGECPFFLNHPWKKAGFQFGVQTAQCKAHVISFHPPIITAWFNRNWPNQLDKDIFPLDLLWRWLGTSKEIFCHWTRINPRAESEKYQPQTQIQVSTHESPWFLEEE